MNNAEYKLSEKRIQLIIWTLLCLMPIIGMTVDLVAPSLPAIDVDLSISNQVTKNIISTYLVGYALGNFFTGFLTDALGRQKLLHLGLFGFILVSLLPVFFPHIDILLLARFLQGVTIGSVAVVARTIFSDILPQEKLVRLGTVIGTMWGLGPVIGPVIGGYLQYYLGWKSCFCFFAIITFIAFIVTFIVVPETHFKRHPLNFKTIKNNFVEVITHKVFMALVILMGLAYSLIITFSTLGPFLIQSKLGYSPVFFGHFALCAGLFFLLGTFICRWLLKKYKVNKIFFIIVNLFFGVSIVAVVMSYIYATSIVLIAMVSVLMFFVTGNIFPLSMGKGLSLFRHIAGTATATMYLINILITSLIGFLISFINVENAISMMWIYLLLMLTCFIVYWSIINWELREV